jgi:tRNA threonylcarbamoyladenosine biosynthesis protein TsaE
MKEISLVLPDLAATTKAGAALGQCLRPGDFVALHGDLGAGKTTLARAVIQSLNPAETEVPSPTFTLVQEYPGPLYHFDLYRLSSPEEVRELGWEEAREGICLVEWPERLGPLLPDSSSDNRFDLRLDYGTSEQSRRLSLSGPDERIKLFGEIWHDRQG